MKFYINCIKAFMNLPVKVIMSVGNTIEISELGNIPQNFVIKNRVNQISVLQNTDIFISHCGMNSTNESLYYGVPLIMFPQQSEQDMVARKVGNLGAGIMLKNNTESSIKDAVEKLINDDNYRKNAVNIGNSFRKSGGASKAADVILSVCKDELSI